MMICRVATIDILPLPRERLDTLPQYYFDADYAALPLR